MTAADTLSDLLARLDAAAERLPGCARRVAQALLLPPWIALLALTGFGDPTGGWR